MSGWAYSEHEVLARRPGRASGRVSKMSAGLRAGIAGKESCAGMVGRLVGQGPRQGVAGQKSRSGLLNWLMCGRQGQACWTGSFAGVQGQTMSIPLAWPVQVTLGWPNTVGCRAHTVVHLIVRQGAWQPCWADSWQPHEVLMQWARAPSHPLEDPPPPQPSLAHNSPYDSHSLLQRFPSGPMPTETDMAAACSLRTGFVLATAECSCQAAAPCSLRTGSVMAAAGCSCQTAAKCKPRRFLSIPVPCRSCLAACPHAAKHASPAPPDHRSRGDGLPAGNAGTRGRRRRKSAAAARGGRSRGLSRTPALCADVWRG